MNDEHVLCTQRSINYRKLYIRISVKAITSNKLIKGFNYFENII